MRAKNRQASQIPDSRVSGVTRERVSLVHLTSYSHTTLAPPADCGFVRRGTPCICLPDYTRTAFIVLWSCRLPLIADLGPFSPSNYNPNSLISVAS